MTITSMAIFQFSQEFSSLILFTSSDSSDKNPKVIELTPINLPFNKECFLSSNIFLKTLYLITYVNNLSRSLPLPPLSYTYIYRRVFRILLRGGKI